MGFVVIRHFRIDGGDEPTTSRVFQQEAEAREAARAWANEGWEVDFLSTGRKRQRRTIRVESPAPMPGRSGKALG